MSREQTFAPVPSQLATPPGGMLVWLFIGLELVTFGAGFIVYLVNRAAEREQFVAAQSALSPGLALINTILLLTSGYIVARGSHLSREGALRAASRHMATGALLGLGFLLIKAFEYAAKIAAGHGPGAGTFESFYWLLTGFHALHVVGGVCILLLMTWSLHRGRLPKDPDLGIETGAAFWHMCDLIWVLMFPLLYLLR